LTRSEQAVILGFELNLDLPSRGRHRRFEAETTHDPLDIGIHTLGRCYECSDADTLGFRKIVAIEATKGQAASGETLEQEGSNMCLIRVSTGDGSDICNLEAST
jgi:hypothetical protein